MHNVWARALTAASALVGAAIPIAGATLLARALHHGAVQTFAWVELSAALNALWPWGGGMVVQGTSRVRWGWWERTFDADRGVGESVAGALALAMVTVGGFFIYAPLCAPVVAHLAPRVPGREDGLVLAALVPLLAVALLRRRREWPLRAWRREAEAPGGGADRERLEARVAAIARLEREDGAFGHVGGIGARTAGLHETLDAERVLRAAREAGVDGAERLHRVSLEGIARRALAAGGFAVYPDAAGRLELTARAVEALGDSLSPEALARQRDFVRACARGGDVFGRSPGGPVEPAGRRWATRIENVG
jgi:hypothetical protein